MDYLKRKKMVENFKEPSGYGYFIVEGYDNMFHAGYKDESEIVMIQPDGFFGIVYDTDGYTLHCHGEYSRVEELWNSKYLKARNNSAFSLKLLKVPRKDFAWINAIINVSSSSWVKALEYHLSIVDTEIVDED